ncbi:MAG: PQQ-dependent sugar dehydrogenase [Chloroflexota bacterium]
MNKKHVRVVVMALILLGTSLIFSPILSKTNAGHGFNAYLPSIFAVRQFEANLTTNTFTNVTDIANAGDERLFVVELAGKIYVMQEDGTKSLFLDLSDKVTTDGTELGMFALVFHPQFDTNGYFYVTYTEIKNDTSWNLRLAQFEVSADPDVANKSSEATILEITMSDDKHNGGGLEFNPVDGRLYLGVGDDDQTMIAQETNSYKGRLVRIEVDSPTRIAQFKTQPLIQLSDEISVAPTASVTRWAKGFRNPWRIVANPLSGSIYVGDVGDRSWEEINQVPIGGADLNYGWPCKEGPEVKLDFTSCNKSFVDPIYAYDEGCAITLGEIYRPNNDNQYPTEILFSDGCLKNIQLLSRPNGEWVAEPLATLPVQPGDYLTTFGIGSDGTIYGGLLGTSTPLYEFYIPPNWDR